MYNSQQKTAFINAHTDSEKTMQLMAQIFNWFEPYETEWGMDLSQQSVDIIQPVINDLSGLRTKSTELVLLVLKQYVKWSALNGYNVSQSIFHVKINSIDKIKNQMVFSPLNLKSILDKKHSDDKIGFDLPEQETVDVTYRVFLWMAFAGLSDKDAIRVTSKDVDVDNLQIHFEGHTYELYKECREDFEKACNLTSFEYVHPNYKTRRYRAPGEIIMRGFLSPTVDLRTIRPIINKRLNAKSGSQDQARKLSYRNIYLSGMFYRGPS